MGQGQARLVEECTTQMPSGSISHRGPPNKLWEIISLLRSPRHYLAINGWHQTCLVQVLFSTESCFHSQAAAYHGVDSFKRKGRRERKRERKKDEKGSWIKLEDYIKRCREIFFSPALQINLSQTKHHYDTVRWISSCWLMAEGWAKPPASWGQSSCSLAAFLSQSLTQLHYNEI